MCGWKGLILAGGTGSRLFPLTHSVNKHLLPVYDKPMIYYPLTTLMLAGVREFVIITNPCDIGPMEKLLGDGRQWGIDIVFRAQERPGGIAEGLRIAEEEIAGRNVALILGDNIFYGSGLPQKLASAMKHKSGATIFAYEVSNPSAFGVVVLGEGRRPIDLVEKPQAAQSKLAVPGLYFYDSSVSELAWSLEPSARGELEITDLNRRYLSKGQLRVIELGRGVAWLDGGTHADLFEASQFIKVVEERTGLKIACPEEVAWRRGFVDDRTFAGLIDAKQSTDYQRYLKSLFAAAQDHASVHAS